MNERDISEIEVDEALEILWTLEEEGKRNKEDFKKRYSNDLRREGRREHRRRFRHGYKGKLSEAVLDVLESRGMIVMAKSEVRLTEKGRTAAKNIVRRHRLAERLFTDILDMSEDEVENPACEFEHLLSEEVTDRICTLLGHPSECPHGMPIPPGKCCKAGRETIKPAIIPLSKVNVGQRVKVAYVVTESHPRLHKLLSYDIGPGSLLKVHQKKPVWIIRAGETDIALEEDVVEDIYVKLL
ncbi:MAG: metal-dependent transcriptional regulator [Thermoplasmata archaeon]